MNEHFAEGVSARDTRCDGEGERNADEKRERRLNQVVEHATGPCDVTLLIVMEFPNRAVRQCSCDASDGQRFCHHQEHHEPAVSIDGRETGSTRLFWWCSFSVHDNGNGARLLARDLLSRTC